MNRPLKIKNMQYLDTETIALLNIIQKFKLGNKSN